MHKAAYGMSILDGCMSVRLTIVIPTFNRASLLERRLQELIPQVQASAGQVALHVFDDASTDHTPQIVERYRAALTRHARWPVNIGIGRNMLHAFDSVEHGWIWTLGDDDPVLPDAVATALDLINRHPSALAINCDSEGGRNLHDHSVSSLPELLAEKEIADILFMSSNLYNLDVLRAYHKVFCQTVGTLCPHLALLLAGLESSGHPLCFSTRQLTLFHHREQRWSSLEAAVGIANLPLYIKDLEAQRLVAQSARSVTRWMLRYGLREVRNAGDFLRWKRYTRMVNQMLACQGAGFANDFKKSRDGDSLLLRIAPEIFAWLPYWMVKGRAKRLRNAHAGDTVLLENSVPVTTKS